MYVAGKKKPSTKTDPTLELIKWGWHKEYGYAIAEGQVKNISSGPADNVTVHFSLYDKNGVFISSSHALIDYRPLLPGQTSPFKVICSDNPEMRRASVDFRELMGGNINWKEREKIKKSK